MASINIGGENAGDGEASASPGWGRAWLLPCMTPWAAWRRLRRLVTAWRPFSAAFECGQRPLAGARTARLLNRPVCARSVLPLQDAEAPGQGGSLGVLQ